jgi:hypothetical protein
MPPGVVISVVLEPFPIPSSNTHASQVLTAFIQRGGAVADASMLTSIRMNHDAFARVAEAAAGSRVVVATAVSGATAFADTIALQSFECRP